MFVLPPLSSLKRCKRTFLTFCISILILKYATKLIHFEGNKSKVVRGTVLNLKSGPYFKKVWETLLYIESLWTVRVPTDHAYCTILMQWNDMKSMRWVWRNGGMKSVTNENGRNAEKNIPRLFFVLHKTHMEWSRRELGTPAVGGERLTAWATEPPNKNK